MNIQGILSIAAVILGCYIIVSHFFDSTPGNDQGSKPFKPRQQFHVGCFLTQHNITHADHISLRIKQLKNQAWRKQRQEVSVVAADYVEKKGVEVARNFENFLVDYANYKSQADINVNLQKAVAKAGEDFRRCLYVLNGKEDFPQNECLYNWQAYLKCKTELNILKNGLNFELGEKNVVVQKMKNLLNPNLDRKQVVSSPHDDLLREIRRKDKQLADKQNILESQLKLINQRRSEAEYNYSISRNNTLHAKELYSECSGHRKQFRLCEELSQEVLSLGHGSIQSLEAKVQRKRIALAKMQKLVNENQGKQFSADLKKLYFQNFEDYKKLLKLFVEAKAKIKKHCGCTQSEQANLKLDVEKSLKDEQDKLNTLNRIIQQQRRKTTLLEKFKQDRKSLLEEQQNKLKKVSKQEPKNTRDPLDVLAELQLQSSKRQQNILKLNTQFNELEYKCDRIKNQLSQKISTISQINDCLNKYQYYTEIKQKFEKDKPKQVKLSEVWKRKFVQSLEEFIY